MPDITIDVSMKDRVMKHLASQYRDESARTGTHVSDLIVCLRRPFLMREYFPDWDSKTLLRFTLGRAFEKVVHEELLLNSNVLLNVEQELEVTHDEEDGTPVLEGHIDIGADPLDVETKFTMKSEDANDPDELFAGNWYWLEQAMTYAVMRRRRSMMFWVFFATRWGLDFVPYLVKWNNSELADHWRVMMARKKYVEGHRILGTLPEKTEHKWACNGCPVYKVCYMDDSRRGKRTRVEETTNSVRGKRRV